MPAFAVTVKCREQEEAKILFSLISALERSTYVSFNLKI